MPSVGRLRSARADTPTTPVAGGTSAVPVGVAPVLAASPPSVPEQEPRRPTRLLDTETGTGLIGTAAGVAVFMVFLLFAVQLTTGLYARSTVSAAGYDAARAVAAKSVDHHDPTAVRAARVQAEANLRQLLGDLGRRAQVSWSIDGETVQLRIRAEAPGILPSQVADTANLSRIDRTFVVHVEEVS